MFLLGAEIKKLGANYIVFAHDGTQVSRKQSLVAAENVVLAGSLAALTAEQRKALNIIVAPSFERGTPIKVTEPDGSVLDAEFFRATASVEYPANSGKLYAVCEILSPIGAECPGKDWTKSSRFKQRYTTYALYLAPSEDVSDNVQAAAKGKTNGRTFKLANAVFDANEMFEQMQADSNVRAFVLAAGVNAFAYPNVTIGETIWWTWGNTRVMPMKVEGDVGLSLRDYRNATLTVTMRCSTLAPYREFKTGDWGNNTPYVFWPEGNERRVDASAEGKEWFRSAKECADTVIPAICETNCFELLGDGCFRYLDKDTFVFELEGGTDSDGDDYTMLVEYHKDEDRWVFERVYEDDTVEERMLPPKKNALMNLGEAAMQRMA